LLESTRRPGLLPEGAAGDSRTALIAAGSGERLSYAELDSRVAAAAALLRLEHKGLVLIVGRHTVDCVVGYLGAWAAGHAVMWLDRGVRPLEFERLVEAYHPEICLVGEGQTPLPVLESYRIEEHEVLGHVAFRDTPCPGELHPELGCLLLTSGSTGSRQAVRLRSTSVVANARAIAQALAVGAHDVAITSVPVAHAYGLSVLNSHLYAGAAIVLSESSIVEGSFWHAVRGHQVTTLAGVPVTYDLLHQLDPTRVVPASVVSMTQAGGHLNRVRREFFRSFMAARGGDFRVMYGQTEATARISVWPADLPADKADSVGKVIPGGAARIDPATGEILYRGPNVMMGYAEGRADLAQPGDIDELHTGDTGYLDGDNYLFLTGRSKRIAKVAGIRVDLDDIERMLGDREVAAIDHDGCLVVFCVNGGHRDAAGIAAALEKRAGLDRSLLKVLSIDALPRSSAGKVLYADLAGLAAVITTGGAPQRLETSS
jgi:acyl-CoA synthetase (AMP-forming)/AMP-acid ligase II